MSSPRVRQTSWILYDFANTIFSMNIVSLHFALWVTKDQGGNDLQYGLTYSGSMLAVIFLAPFLGKWADLHLKRRLFLIFSTLICVISTACIGILNELTVGLMLFFVANIGYQLAQVFYMA